METIPKQRRKPWAHVNEWTWFVSGVWIADLLALVGVIVIVALLALLVHL